MGVFGVGCASLVGMAGSEACTPVKVLIGVAELTPESEGVMPGTANEGSVGMNEHVQRKVCECPCATHLAGGHPCPAQQFVCVLSFPACTCLDLHTRSDL